MLTIQNAAQSTSNFLKSNIGTIGAGIGGAALGGAVGLFASRKSSSSASRKRKKRKNSYVRKKHNRTKRRGRRTPRTAGKRKDTSHKRIRYTKKGQPYVIMGNGRARFIKKSGAKRSHKQKGGRY